MIDIKAVVFIFRRQLGIGGPLSDGRTFVPVTLPKQSDWLEALWLLRATRYVVLLGN
jgi:hypothetical protein